MDIDKARQIHMAWAEALDAWRIVPRALVALYCYMLYKVIVWYMALEPHMIEGCKAQDMSQCIVQAPSTQHAALVTAVVGIAAAVFGLYTTSGKKWGGFIPWKNSKKENTTEEPINKESDEIIE